MLSPALTLGVAALKTKDVRKSRLALPFTMKYDYSADIREILCPALPLGVAALETEDISKSRLALRMSSVFSSCNAERRKKLSNVNTLFMFNSKLKSKPTFANVFCFQQLQSREEEKMTILTTSEWIDHNLADNIDNMQLCSLVNWGASWLFRIFSIFGGCHAERYRDVQYFSNASAVLIFCSQGKMRGRKLTAVQLSLAVSKLRSNLTIENFSKICLYSSQSAKR